MTVEPRQYTRNRPTHREIVRDREERDRTRASVRSQCVASGEPSHVKAAAMASEGYGVLTIMLATGIPERVAKLLVLGRDE